MHQDVIKSKGQRSRCDQISNFNDPHHVPNDVSQVLNGFLKFSIVFLKGVPNSTSLYIVPIILYLKFSPFSLLGRQLSLSWGWANDDDDDDDDGLPFKKLKIK